MIKLSNGDKLCTLTEVLDNIRKYMKKNLIKNLDDIDTDILALAFDETEDFIKGALRVWR